MEKFKDFKKIKVEDAIKWMEKFEEDPIVDGPYYDLSDEQKNYFVNSLSEETKKELVDYNCLSSTAELTHDDTSIGGGHIEPVEKDILNCFVNMLNKYNLENLYLKDIKRF